MSLFRCTQLVLIQGKEGPETREAGTRPASSVVVIDLRSDQVPLGVNPMTWTPAPRTMSDALIQS